jgi:hypothetical protein
MVQVLGSIQDERTFSNFSFMKNKLLEVVNNSFRLVLKCLVIIFSHCLTSHMMVQLHYGRSDNEILGSIVNLIYGFGGLCSSCRIMYVKSFANLV